MSIWKLREASVNIKLMAGTLGISEVLATVLANRNIRTKHAALKFLNPELKYQYDPFLMQGMEAAVKLVTDAASKGKKIIVYGDYDADGVTSTVILYKTLKSFGADVEYYIPHREREGYGLGIVNVKAFNDMEAGMILTCDNGIAAINEIKLAKELGMEVVVIDHHEPVEGSLPEADAVVDPKREDCKYPFKYLCAGGLAYKFARAFHDYNEIDFLLHDEFLILAAIATFCDIVELVDENRIIAKNGLKFLNTGKNTNLGLKALLKQRNLEGKELTEFDIGFIIGPCINASGRLEMAGLAVQLFLTENESEAADLAVKLSELNDERKAITVSSTEAALAKLGEPDSVVIIYSAEIHESVAGIVAGRIKERLYRPVLVLTKSGEFVKGSARSIEGYNIFEALSKCRDMFTRFGGHSMAAGLTMQEKDIPVLRRRINEDCKLKEEDFQETIYIDGEMPLEAASFELASELEILKPHGRDNMQPYFLTRNVKVVQIDFLGENGKTLRFTFDNRIKGICFGQYEKLEKTLTEKYPNNYGSIMSSGKNLFLNFDIIYSLEINEYNGNKYTQIRIKDFKLADAKGAVI